MVFDTGLTAQFDQIGPLLIGLTWLAGLVIAAAVIFARRSTLP
ncbi:hypothetical protein [Mycolicibacterium gilvum]|uniref:Putative ABC transporter membrane protein n=1 Tax=Mycolicibacterium gilvum TaxID=1804 RepID=A0A378SGI1_9MYCO|nr:hypothetical protein [Mycolicibacterium gilvum]STZ41475.1 putative ABC transporter membrane protein [Mycolicibacterium gilvum]